jgi:hypothetical protein
MQLSKYQVKAFLNVMGDDTSRPVLYGAYVDEYEGRTVLVATNGYVLAALDTPELSEHKGEFINRNTFKQWHKDHSAKVQMTSDDIIAALQPLKTSETNWAYPKWQLIIDGLKPGSVDKIAINGRYMDTMQDLNDGEPMTWGFSEGKYSPVIARANNNIYVIMPLRPQL